MSNTGTNDPRSDDNVDKELEENHSSSPDSNPTETDLESGTLGGSSTSQKRKQVTRDDNEDDDQDEPPAKKLNFKLDDFIPEEELHDWALPEDLAKFYSKYCRTHITDQDMKERMREFPVPTNVEGPPHLDDYMKRTLATSKQTIAMDDDWSAVQDHVQRVMGPLGVAWSSLETVRAGGSVAEMNADTLGDQLQKAVVLLGHAFQKISWFRRIHCLSALGKHGEATKIVKQEKVKEIFKNNSSGDLFSKEFDDHFKVVTTTGKNISAALQPAKPQPNKGKNTKEGKKPFSFIPPRSGGGKPVIVIIIPRPVGESFLKVFKIEPR